MTDVTRILNAIGDGDRRAADTLLPIVYDELRRLAAQKLFHEKPGQTLQATALVHEAYIRLVGSGDPGWENRRHFFGAAAEAMRRILVERARAKARLKRGGDRQRVDLAEVDLAAEESPEDVVALDEALDRLAGEDPVAAEVVKLRYFAGLTNEETGQALGFSASTAKRHWRYARVWLLREIDRTTQ
jgi:RNA polymerase sigma factor (TIGR02999 family)